MLKIHKLTFNPFSENTYIVADETNQCAIIDPGCCNDKERNELLSTIEAYGLKPVLLLNTHCHIDHIPGNKFVFEKYGLLPQIHKNELEILQLAPQFGKFFGFDCPESPLPDTFLEAGDDVKLGNTVFKVLFTPGHSPGSICFYSPADKAVISGDVLFYRSVGRFDLPESNGKDLYNSLVNVMMKLPDEVTVYSGHGPETSIGFERYNNPFIQDEASFG
jgi:glyoxylase-like metal-dependent hydrolase (beta-lactamase superfamily II)